MKHPLLRFAAPFRALANYASAAESGVKGVRVLFALNMRQEIVVKLDCEFDSEIASERQVVYILVETRKLLEQQGTLTNFRALKLCSDWAVHPKLRGPDAQFVLGNFDAYEQEYQRSRVTMAEFNLDPLSDFVSHKAFRAELMQALAGSGANVDRLRSDVYWQSFIQHYTAVIQDCPLEAVGNATQLVSHVQCLAWPKEKANAIYPGRCVIEWNWTLKSGAQRQKVVCALI